MFAVTIPQMAAVAVAFFFLIIAGYFVNRIRSGGDMQSKVTSLKK